MIGDGRREILGVLVGMALGVAAAAAPAMAQDAGEVDEAMVQMMAAWASYAEVGPPHEALGERAGQWSATVKFWYTPDAPPEVSEATSTGEPIMGGRYLLERFASTMPDGSPFEGMGLVGYDNLRDQFVAMWIDSMSSGILTAESTAYSDDFSRIEYRGEAPDPVAGSYKVQRSVEYWPDDDTRVMEAWETGPDGDEMKVMEITYRRR
jgi:hypothetical protein